MVIRLLIDGLSNEMDGSKMECDRKWMERGREKVSRGNHRDVGVGFEDGMGGKEGTGGFFTSSFSCLSLV